MARMHQRGLPLIQGLTKLIGEKFKQIAERIAIICKVIQE